jgi:hypothetical protein
MDSEMNKRCLALNFTITMLISARRIEFSVMELFYHEIVLRNVTRRALGGKNLH